MPRPLRSPRSLLLVVLSSLLLTVSLGCGRGIDASAPDEQLFQSALTAYEAGQYAAAQVKFDQLLTEHPTSPRADNAAYLTGRCRYELDDFPGALAALNSMRQRFPSSPFVPDAAYFCGRARFKQLDYVGAIVDFRETVTTDAAGTFADNAQYYLGRSHYELGELPAAATELEALEQRYPQSSYLDNGRYYLGRSYFDRRLFSEAIGPFERLLPMPVSTVTDNAHYFLGRCRYALATLDAAWDHFADVLSLFPTSQWGDNALYYQVRIAVDQANCGVATQKLEALRTGFSGSTLIGTAETYMAANGC